MTSRLGSGSRDGSVFTEADKRRRRVTSAKSATTGIVQRREAAISAALLVTLLIFTLLRPSNFATISNITNIAIDGSVLAVLSVGMTFIIVMGVFDLSIGSVLVFAQVTSVSVMGILRLNAILVALLGLAVAIAAGAAWGTINGFLAARLDLTPFIVTLATFGAAFGAAELISGGNDLTTFRCT
jgi:ribose transport system permease protein